MQRLFFNLLYNTKGDRMDLFTQNADRLAPLADRMRPTTLDAFVGQAHIVGPGRLLRRAIETDSLTSSIFFRAAGHGENDARVHYRAYQPARRLKSSNAVTSGVKEVRAVIDAAEKPAQALRQGEPISCWTSAIAGRARSRIPYCPPSRRESSASLVLQPKTRLYQCQALS